MLGKQASLFAVLGSLALLLGTATALADDIYLDQTYLALKAKQTVFFSAQMSASQPLIYDTAPTGSYGADLEWNFAQTYSLGVEFSYRRPFEPEDDNYNGWNDLIFYFTDKDLWSDHRNRWNLSYKLAAVFPISDRSLNASLIWGTSEQILLRKGFGGWSLMYALDFEEDYYSYDTVDSAAPVPRYNSPYAIANRVVGVVQLGHGWRWMSATQIRTSTDFNGSTSSMYSVSTGLAVDVAKNWTIDTGIRSAVRDTGSPAYLQSNTSSSDSNVSAPDATGFGGSMGTYLFDPYGTQVYLGTTIRI